MREITHEITDIDESYEDLVKTLKHKNIPFDGVFIETCSRVAYVWKEQLPIIVPPPTDARA